MSEPSYADRESAIPWGKTLSYSVDFLLDLLEEKPQRSDTVFAKGISAGFNRRTLYRAKKFMGIETRYVEGKSYWFLPERNRGKSTR